MLYTWVFDSDLIIGLCTIIQSFIGVTSLVLEIGSLQYWGIRGAVFTGVDFELCSLQTSKSHETLQKGFSYHSTTNTFVSLKKVYNWLRKSCWKWAERYFEVFRRKKYEGVEVSLWNFQQRCTLMILTSSKNFKFMTSRVRSLEPRPQNRKGRGHWAWPWYFFTKICTNVSVHKRNIVWKFQVNMRSGPRVMTNRRVLGGVKFGAWSRPNQKYFYYPFSQKMVSDLFWTDSESFMHIPASVPKL